ncbi:MAG: SDR family oxidoreductase [Polyangiales bacterium]
MSEPKVVLITGCSTGIGRALALQLVQRGCHVFGSARNPATLSALQAAGGVALALDVTSQPSIDAAVAEVIARAGRIDMLINNAGINTFGPVGEVAIADVARLFDTNVRGLVAVTQAVFPHMVKAKRGRIVNIGSVVGLLPTPFTGPYCASKAAVHTLSEVLRMEAAPLGIDVVVVQPGGVRSQIAESGASDLARYERPESLYHWARAGIAKRAGASQNNPVSAEDFAAEVVPKLLAARAPNTILAGRGAHAFAALARLPYAIRARILGRTFGLDAPR